jgi:hypothetical protein
MPVLPSDLKHAPRFLGVILSVATNQWRSALAESYNLQGRGRVAA